MYLGYFPIPLVVIFMQLRSVFVRVEALCLTSSWNSHFLCALLWLVGLPQLLKLDKSQDLVPEVFAEFALVRVVLVGVGDFLHSLGIVIWHLRITKMGDKFLFTGSGKGLLTSKTEVQI